MPPDPFDPDELPAMAVVPVHGALPFALVHGESSVAAASWAAGAAGLHLLDASVPWERVREAAREDARPLVVHDPLCPLTPADFLLACLELCRATGAVVVGCRPVTDTVKHVHGRRLGATVDRAGLAVVTSPVVLPAAVVAGLESLDTSDLPGLVGELVQRLPVRMLTAPALGRRVADERDLDVLAALSEVHRTPG